MGKGAEWHNTQFCGLRSTRATRQGRWKPITKDRKNSMPAIPTLTQAGANAQSYGVIVVCSFERISFKKNAQEMRVLSLLEEQRLLSVLFKDFDRYKMGVFICLYTGIRIGELCALQWKNVSLSENAIKIEYTMQRLQSENLNALQKTRIIVTEPKSYAALRTIPLPEFVIDVIKPFAGSPNTYVLSGECKKIIEPRIMQNRFKAYLAEGKIEEARSLCIRVCNAYA